MPDATGAQGEQGKIVKCYLFWNLVMNAPKTQEKLQEAIQLVRDLLSKQKLVENMVHKTESANKELIESLVHRQHLVELQTKLSRLHTADIAHILESLPIKDRNLVWDQIRDKRGGDVILEVSDSVRESLIQSMTDDELLAVLQQIDADDIAYIADDIPPRVLEVRSNSMPMDDKDWIRSAMEYDEDTVGYLMSSEMVVVKDTDTVGSAAGSLRILDELPVHNDKLFVTDKRGVLVGVLSLQALLLNDPSSPVVDVMATNVVRLSPDDSASEASKAFERYDLVSAPVVNQRGKLIGRVTVDVVMDYIRDESSEDVINMMGLQEEEDLFAPVLSSARNRGLWLIVNLFTAFIVAYVIGFFEEAIAQLVALAVLMPIVASIGGNTGNQTTALIIRGISLGMVNKENIIHLFRKELSVSFLNGLILGLAVAVFAYLFFQNFYLSVVIGVAMVLTLIVAAMLGLGVPLLLEKFGRDPALGSSVITTATTDSVGFFIFLGLATVFLL